MVCMFMFEAGPVYIVLVVQNLLTVCLDMFTYLHIFVDMWQMSFNKHEVISSYIPTLTLYAPTFLFCLFLFPQFSIVFPTTEYNPTPTHILWTIFMICLLHSEPQHVFTIFLYFVWHETIIIISKGTKPQNIANYIYVYIHVTIYVYIHIYIYT